MPVVDELAPDFTLPQNGGNLVTLSNLRGNAVVLFFYPRDDTPGCTRESIEFSEFLQEFSDAGAHILGISKDSISSHEKFASKHNLTVALASDENGSTCEDYGVWKEKNMYGKKYMGIERTTFLIGADGKTKRVWNKVKVPGHVQDVLEALRAL